MGGWVSLNGCGCLDGSERMAGRKDGGVDVDRGDIKTLLASSTALPDCYKP